MSDEFRFLGENGTKCILQLLTNLKSIINNITSGITSVPNATNAGTAAKATWSSGEAPTDTPALRDVYFGFDDMEVGAELPTGTIYCVLEPISE